MQGLLVTPAMIICRGYSQDFRQKVTCISKYDTQFHGKTRAGQPVWLHIPGVHLLWGVLITSHQFVSIYLTVIIRIANQSMSVAEEVEATWPLTILMNSADAANHFIGENHTESHGLTQAQLFFESIVASVPPNDLIRQVRHAADVLRRNSEGTELSWAGLLCIVQWPKNVLFESWFQGSLLDTYLSTVAKHVATHNLALSAVYSHLQRPAAELHLNALHHKLTLILLSHPKLSGDQLRGVYAIMCAMQQLYLANIAKSDDDSSKLSHEAFYNDVVNVQVNLVTDFNQYLKFRREGDQTLFSFSRFPFVLNAHSKARLMQAETSTIQNGRMGGLPFLQPSFTLTVSRDSLVEDAVRRISAAPPSMLRRKLRVQFVGEEGIDEGGLSKEFFQLIVRQLFDVSYGMFSADEEAGTLFFEPTSPASPDEYRLVGQLLGLSVFNSIILDIRFPPVVYRRLFGMPITEDDFVNTFPEFGRNLRKLREMTAEEIDSLALAFTTTQSSFGDAHTVELCPNGSDKLVTKANVEEYIAAIVDYRLCKSVAWQFDAFASGFTTVCMCEALRLFRPEELELAITGSPILDFHALQRVARYEGSDFTAESPVVGWFWSVVHNDLTAKQQQRLLSFITGSSRAPTDGLGHMELRVIKNGVGDRRLPTAHTCFNAFMLPVYSSREVLKEMLLLAIENAEGFGLK